MPLLTLNVKNLAQSELRKIDKPRERQGYRLLSRMDDVAQKEVAAGGRQGYSLAKRVRRIDYSIRLFNIDFLSTITLIFLQNTFTISSCEHIKGMNSKILQIR